MNFEMFFSKITQIFIKIDKSPKNNSRIAIKAMKMDKNIEILPTGWK